MSQRTRIPSFLEYDNSQNAIVEICSRYNNSRSELINTYNQFRRLGRASGSQVARDRQRLIRLERLIKLYEQSLFDQMLTQPHCDNCERYASERAFNDTSIDSNSPYLLSLTNISGDRISTGARTFKFCQHSKDPTVLYTVCSQCKEHLCCSDRKRYNHFSNIWPSFFWNILKSRQCQKQYGILLWRFIPLQWRPWWQEILKARFPSIFHSITLDTPSSAFHDVTRARNSFCVDIDPSRETMNGLQLLRDACNKYLLPTVLCPFGCTEYLHKCNHLSLALILQRYLPKVRLRLPTGCHKRSVLKLAGCRDDYIREYNDYDTWLLNPAWNVLPSIAFDNEMSPIVLCCRHHSSRTSGFMVHTPRHPGHILPAAMPDQLAHACIRPRTVNQLRRSYGSNSYQMYRQDGSFNGIDTCSCTHFGRFDFCSYLSSMDEALSIRHRPDCNALLSSLASVGVISDAIANDRRSAAEESLRDFSYDKYTTGATYVPLRAAVMFLQEQACENTITFINDRRGDNRNGSISCKTKRPWSLALYPCQKLNPHGAMPPMIPSMGSVKTRGILIDRKIERLWSLCAALSQIECLWEHVASQPSYRTSQWMGWIISYVSRHCFPLTTSMTRHANPFLKHVTDNLDRMIQKIDDVVLDGRTSWDMFSELLSVAVMHYTSSTNSFSSVQDAFDSCIITDNTLMFFLINYMHNSRDVLPFTIIHDSDVFELRWVYLAGQENHWNDSSLQFETYMRHGNGGHDYHFKWWNTQRGELPIQCDRPLFQSACSYVLAYVKVFTPEMKSIGCEMMNYIGGQSHYRCSIHKLPVIISTQRHRTCSNVDCSRKEHYVCPYQQCCTVICKTCVDSAPDNAITFSNESHNDTVNDNNILEEPYDEMELTNEEDFEDHEEFMELMNDYLTTDGTIGAQHDYWYDPTDESCSDDEHMNIPSTDAGEIPFSIREDATYKGQFGNITISGHVLLNQCGSLLTRKHHQIKGSSRHHNLLQKICATNIGTSVPLLQPEAMLFPSIFPKMVTRENIILGAIPSSFLTESMSKFGFQSIPSHVRARLTSSSSKTSTDPRYISFCYDMMTNLSATHLDVRIAMNRGLTAADDKFGGMGVRGGNDSSSSEFLGTIDSSKCVKNLCAAQMYHPQDFFVTLTCNQLRHFGTAMVKKWIDANAWLTNFPGYKRLSSIEVNELSIAVQQAASGLLLRNWQEVCALLIAFLRKSPNSPFRKVNSIFSRNEYQKDVGNLSHIHLILQVDWGNLSAAEENYMDELIRADVMSIVKSQDVRSLIDEGLLESFDDVKYAHHDANTFLAHRCNERCLEMIGPNEYRCRKPNYGRITKDNTRNTYMPLPNDLPQECLERLVRIGLAEVSGSGFGSSLLQPTYKHEFFTPSRHIPPIDHNSDSNMSPVESRLFLLCRSMQNVQLIRGCGGCNKYICKYIAKIDEQNYVVVSVHKNGNGQLVTKSNFLHNTKISRSARNENDVRMGSREYNRPQGRAISLMEMLHVMLKYPEVITDLRFVDIPTVSLELRSRVGISADRETQDGAFTIPEIIEKRRTTCISHGFRTHTPAECRIINDLNLSQTKVDRITQFSIRPPELRSIFDSPGKYFRWVIIDANRKSVHGEKLETAITDNLATTVFVDGLSRVVKINHMALSEIKEHLNEITSTDSQEDGSISSMKLYFHRLFHVLDVSQTTIEGLENEGSQLTDADADFLVHIKKHVIDEMYEGHLPVPVYSYVRPTSGHKFILHILLSMGRFHTESELTMHSSLRDCFRAARLIGPDNDVESLQAYSDALLFRFIVEQLCYFSNSRRILAEWIVLVGDIFDSVIVKDELLVTDMPSVQLSSILQSNDLADVEFRQGRKRRILEAAFKELGEDITSKIPSMNSILQSSKEHIVSWDPLATFHQSSTQSDASYREQKLAIQVTCQSIDKYRQITMAPTLTKNVGIRGFPGGGKTFCSMYCIVYAISCGLDCLTTAMMARRATTLGGTHWHKFFCLPIDTKLTPQRIAELALQKINNSSILLNAIQSLDVIFADELGQLSAEFVAAINIILCRIRGTGQMFGGILMIGSLDHTQIQPWEGKPFLSSPLLIPTFVMIKLSHSVRTTNAALFEMQSIARQPHDELCKRIGTRDDLVERFISLASQHFTFVDKWDHGAITSSTFRVYSKKVPVADAARIFVERVVQEFSEKREAIILKSASDIFKVNGSRQDFRAASIEISNAMNLKTKVPPQICFFKGAVFECTFNCPNNSFMNSDPVLMYEIPNVDMVNKWKPIPMLRFPSGWKDFDLVVSQPKDFFIQNGFKEIKIPTAPQYTLSLPNSIHGKRKQYGVRHRITGTIHGAMGDTYESMASEISHANPDYGLWDRGQLVVIISRTRIPQRTIFVGSKSETLATLRRVLLKKTQWTDYISDILDVITTNRENTPSERIIFPTNYPFRIRDMTLPDDNSGIVYMLNSLRKRSFTYIGKTKNPRKRLKNHNSGYGSSSTEPCHLRPFAVMAYIAGFEGNDELLLAAERKWKYVRDNLIRSGEMCVQEWALAGRQVIADANLQQQYGVSEYDLRLVILFAQ